MKKKLLTSAAIASFLTAAGVVIPQTDIFAVDTQIHHTQVHYLVINQVQFQMNS